MSKFIEKFKFLLPAALTVFALAVCDRSDLISGAGTTIIDDLDSTLSNPNNGMIYQTVDFGMSDMSDLVKPYSLPIGADPAFSTHIVVRSVNGEFGYFIVGVGADGDTAIANAQFRVSPFDADNALYTAPAGTTPGDTLVDAYMFFRNTLAAPVNVNVYLSDTLVWGSGSGADSLLLINAEPVNRDKARLWNCLDDEEGVARMNNDIPNGENTPCVASIGGSLDAIGGRLDSIRLPREVARAIYDKRTERQQNPGIDTDDYSFAMNIIDYDGGLLRISVPYVILNVKRYENAEIVRDSITINLARYTVLEDPEVAAARSALPYSSQLTKRTAVFEINVDAFVENPNRGELINAVLALVANRGTSSDTDETDIEIASIDADLFSAFGHHLKLENEFAVSGNSDSIALALGRQFSLVQNVSAQRGNGIRNLPITEPFNALTVKQSLMRTLLSPSANGNTIYIYLRPTVENTTILWDIPHKIDVVFTRAR